MTVIPIAWLADRPALTIATPVTIPQAAVAVAAGSTARVPQRNSLRALSLAGSMD
jgi:hypothetical protein